MPKRPEINANNVDYLVEKFNSIETGETSAESLINSKDFANYTGPDAFRVGIEAKMIENQPKNAAAKAGIKNSYAEAFQQAFYSELGIEATQDISILDKDEREAFAQSILASGGGYTQQTGMIATNINPLLDDLFYNNSILADVTKWPDGEEKEDVTDITNERTAVQGAESQTGTPADNTTVSETLDPSNVSFIDVHDLSRLFKLVENPVNAGIRTAKMLRAIMIQAETAIIGSAASDTRGANQFYSILNNKASTGTNKGSLALTLSIVAGVRPVNHIDAINHAMSLHSGVFAPEDAKRYTPVVNYATWMRLVRTLDANNLPYYDATTDSFPQLVCKPKPRVVSTALANDVVGLWDLSKYMVKKLAPIQLQSVFNPQTMQWRTYMEAYMDGTMRMAYKATPTKNAFRHFSLKTDYTV